MFTLIINYTKPLDEVNKVREEHLAFVIKHFEQGTFIACGRQEPNEQGVVEGGLIWTRGMPRTQLDAIIAQDPYVIENVAEYKIIEFNPLRHHANLKELL